MRFDYLLIGFCLFSFTIIVGVMMMNDFNENYVQQNITNVTMDNSSFGNVYNTVNDMYNISRSGKEKTLDAEISSGTDSWESMTKGSYSAITLIKNSFKLVTDIGNAISVTLGLGENNIVVQVLFVCFSLTIIFSIIYMIFRFIPR